MRKKEKQTAREKRERYTHLNAEFQRIAKKKNKKKLGLKLNIQKTKIMASGPITSWQIDEETVTDFIFGAPKSLQW